MKIPTAPALGIVALCSVAACSSPADETGTADDSHASPAREESAEAAERSAQDPTERKARDSDQQPAAEKTPHEEAAPSKTGSKGRLLWCTACTVLGELEEVLGDIGTAPDLLVDLRPFEGCESVDPAKLGSSEPATCSIQAALDFLNQKGDPSPGDGRIFVGVTDSGDSLDTVNCQEEIDGAARLTGRAAGGGTTTNLSVENRNPEELVLAGCGIEARVADPAQSVISVQGGKGATHLVGLDTKGSAGPGYRIQDTQGAVSVRAAAISDTSTGVRIADTSGPVALSHLAITNVTGNGIEIQQVQGLSMRRVTIRSPGGHGLRAIELAGPAEISECAISGIDNPDTSGIDLVNGEVDLSELRLVGNRFSESTSGRSFVLLTGRQAATLNLQADSNTFSGLTGHAIQSVAGDGDGSSSRIVAGVRNSTFDAATSNGLSGIAVISTASGSQKVDITGNTLRQIGRPRLNTGVILLQTFDAGSLEVAISGNNVEHTTTRAIHLATENTGDARSRVTIEDNEIDAIQREAIYVSARGSTADLGVIVKGNRIGRTSPVGTAGREGIEILSEDDSSLAVSIIDNTVVSAGPSERDETLDIDAEDRSTLDAVVTANQLTGSSATGVIFHAETEGDGSLCLRLDGNTARPPGVFVLAAGNDYFTMESLASVAADNSGDVRVGDGIRAHSGSCRTPR